MIKFKKRYRFWIIKRGVEKMENIRETKGKKWNVKVIDSAKHRDSITDSDAEMDARAVQAVKAAVFKAEFCKKPVARYDTATKQAYVEYPDGRRVDVG